MCASFSRLARYAGASAALAAGSALAWGYIERLHPRLRRYSIVLPAERAVSPVTLFHMGDLHLFRGQEFIIDFLEEVAATEHIDFVVSTGDNFGATDALDMVKAAHSPFSHIPGAFVFGSNDYFSPRAKSWTRYLRRDPRVADAAKPKRTPDLPTEELRAFLTGFGWLDLNNASVSVRLTHGSPTLSSESAPPSSDAESPFARLALTGVDDPHIDRDQPVSLPSAWHMPDVITLGVTHAPYRRVVDGWTVAGADLILAGHTHGGQLGLPGVTSVVTNCDLPRSHGKGLHPWIVDDLSPYAGDLAERRYESWLHVTAGLGTSPFVPFRIATPPEASLITIASAGS